MTQIIKRKQRKQQSQFHALVTKLLTKTINPTFIILLLLNIGGETIIIDKCIDDLQKLEDEPSEENTNKIRFAAIGFHVQLGVTCFVMKYVKHPSFELFSQNT